MDDDHQGADTTGAKFWIWLFVLLLFAMILTAGAVRHNAEHHHHPASLVIAETPHHLPPVIVAEAPKPAPETTMQAPALPPVVIDTPVTEAKPALPPALAPLFPNANTEKQPPELKPSVDLPEEIAPAPSPVNDLRAGRPVKDISHRRHHWVGHHHHSRHHRHHIGHTDTLGDHSLPARFCKVTARTAGLIR